MNAHLDALGPGRVHAATALMSEKVGEVRIKHTIDARSGTGVGVNLKKRVHENAIKVIKHKNVDSSPSDFVQKARTQKCMAISANTVIAPFPLDFQLWVKNILFCQESEKNNDGLHCCLA